MSGHTPGPWTVQPCSHGGMLLRRGDQLGRGIHVQSSIQILPEADARLMSASPDLLAALKAVTNRTEMGTALFHKLTEEHAEAALAAIAKAEVGSE